MAGGKIPWLAIALALGLMSGTALAAQQAGGTIQGRVTDAGTGEPIAGAQVSVNGTGLGALSNTAGQYLINGVKAGRAQVRVTIIGYGPVSKEVVVANGPVTLDFEISQTAVALDELVVTATGQERKRQIGNSVSTINPGEFAATAVANPQDILAASSPGVSVLQNSGQPGAGGNIRLRGNNSVSQGNSPIIYLDGIRIYNGSAPTSIASRQAAMPLNDISPADIERIEVIKGPAATTLYGTEASGGVIQIFTKGGVTGTPQWNAEVGAGFNSMGHVGASSDPTGMFLNECSGPNMVVGDGTRFEDPSCPASGSWLKRGAIQRYGLSVRGGAGDMTYYLAGNYKDERGVLGDGGTADGGFRANFSFLPSPKLKVAVSSSYTRRNTQWIPDGNNANGVLLNLSRGPFNNFKGTDCSDPGVVCLDNGAIFTTDNTTKSDHYISGISLNYNPSDALTNRFSLGYDYNNLDNNTLDPFGFPRVPLGELWWDGWKRVLLSADYAGSYNMKLFGLATTSSWGAQLFDSRSTRTSVDAADFSGPGEPTLTSAAQRDVTNSSYLREINAGFFLQEQVAFQDRLFLTAGLRVDGNSSFGESFGLQPYPKLSASYVLSDYAFWPRAIETFKLRGAIGESGKAPGAFDAVRTWQPIAGDNGQPGFTPAQIGNPDLGPERTRETEVGFDASALRGRIGLEVTYYNQHTFDALIPMVFPPSEGFSATQLENVGEIYNSGFETRLDLGLVRADEVELNAHLNFSTVHSEAGDVGGERLIINDLSRTYVEDGYPVPSYFGKKVANPDAYEDPVFVTDATGSVASTYLGSAYPTKIISPSMDLTLMKRLTFQALGEWQLGGHLLNATGYQNAYKQTWQPCYGVQAKLKAAAGGDEHALDDVTALERARCTLTSSIRDYALWVESTDFFKLRSISLTYAIPDRFIPGGHNTSLTVAGRNLFKWSDFSGADPEVADQRDGSFSRRDYYVLPPARTFLATLRVDF